MSVGYTDKVAKLYTLGRPKKVFVFVLSGEEK